MSLQTIRDPSIVFSDFAKVSASYIIFTDGNKIYAKNGDTGNIEYIDTDISNLLQNVINTLYSNYGGGKIFIKRGTYYPTKTVNIPDGINLIIEGEGNNTVFRYTSQFDLFVHNPSNPTWSSTILFKDLKIDRSGSGSNISNCFYINYTKIVVFENIEIIDDYRTVTDNDDGIRGNNNIIAIAVRNRIYNKSFGIWLFGFISIFRENYVENTCYVGIAGAGLLPQHLIPAGFTSGGITIIENNVCVDCGRQDEAVAVDYVSSNPVINGLGIIRNNLVLTKNYTMNSAIVSIRTSHIIIKNNKIQGSISGNVIALPYDQTINYYVVKSNTVNVTMTSTETRPIIGLSNYIDIEGNDFIINSSSTSNINTLSEIQGDFVRFSNNRIIINAPQATQIPHAFVVDALGNMNFYAVVNNNYIVSPIDPGSPGFVLFASNKTVNHFIRLENNYLLSQKGSIPFVAIRGYNVNATFNAVIKNNVAGALNNSINIYSEISGYTTTVNLDTDASVTLGSGGIVYYAKENSGKTTFNGDGTTTQFKIVHNLISTPSKVLVTPASSDATGSFYVTADATYIYVNYLTAPPSGTNNVVLNWYAKV